MLKKKHFSISFIVYFSYFPSCAFFIPVLTDGLSLNSESKSTQFSRTLLSILADFNNAVVWMVSTRPLISKSSSPFINPLVTVPREPITISINITFMFCSFFKCLERSKYISFLSLSFNFTQWSAATAKSQLCKVSFLLIIIRSGRRSDIR